MVRHGRSLCLDLSVYASYQPRGSDGIFSVRYGTGDPVLDSIIFVYILLDDSNDLLPLDESIDHIVHRKAAAASLVRTYTGGIYSERRRSAQNCEITVCACSKHCESITPARRHRR